MRREVSIVGLTIVVYAAALVLGTLLICNTGNASELSGDRATQGNAAHVRIERCAGGQDLLCGIVNCAAPAYSTYRAAYCFSARHSCGDA
jgi:hypothetical protein